MLIENLVNGWFKVWVVAVLLFGTVACDSSDGEGNLSLAAPAIGQSEERSTEPVLLAFGWSAVEDAAEYAYRLDEVVGEELHPLLSGKTAATSVELGGERGRTLSLGTTYRFSVQALPAEGVTLSASAFASSASTSIRLPRGTAYSVVPTMKEVTPSPLASTTATPLTPAIFTTNAS